MPTASQVAAAPGTVRVRDATVQTLLRWAPPADVVELLQSRGVERRVRDWLSRWNDALGGGLRAVERARAATFRTATRSYRASYGARSEVITWSEVGLPNADGSTWWLDLGDPAQWDDVFADAVRPGGTGLGGYRPRNFQEAVIWARNRGALFSRGAVYAAGAARDALRRLGDLYALERGRADASADAAQAAAAQAAAAREADRLEAERREWLASRPERMQRAREIFARVQQSDSRFAGRLERTAERVGAAGVVTLMRQAADAADAAAAAAAAAGADAAEAETAAEAAADAVIEAQTAADVLWPLEAPEWYTATWSLLPLDWQLLHLVWLYPDDPTTAAITLQSPDWYAANVGTLLPGWAHLFFHLSTTMPSEAP